MKNFGRKIPKLPAQSLTKVRDLEYFEGSLLAEFKSESGDSYLFLWRDSDDKHNRWLVFRTSRREITLYLAGEVTLQGLILSCPDGFVYLVDINEEGDHSSVSMQFTEELPEEYIPSPTSFHNSALAPKDGEVLGTHAILLQGELDYLDLGTLPRKYRDVYTIQYLLGSDHQNRKNAPGHPFKYDMKGGYVYATMFKELLKSVPNEDRPRLQAVQYASPGVINLKVNNHVAELVASAIKRFAADSDYLDLLKHELDRWLHSKDEKAKSKAQSSVEAKNPIPIPSDSEVDDKLLPSLCARLALDLSHLKSKCPDLKQRVQIVLSYFRRVKSLAKYQSEGTARVV